jgi:ribosomal protein S18 acetylase RimI-like enzyme
MQYKLINKHSGADLFHTNDMVAEFLFHHLEQYGDQKEDILKAIEYIFEEYKGGHMLLALEGNEIVGAVVINNTNMSGYIPENILVYIAVHKNQRGKGTGKELMKQVIKLTKGSIALHVEPDNPALHLYEKVGFTNKYLEMRLEKA